MGFSIALVVRNLLVNAEDARDTVSVPGSGRSPRVGNDIPHQHSWLKNSMDKEAWKAKFHGAAKSWTWLSNSDKNSFFSHKNVQGGIASWLYSWKPCAQIKFVVLEKGEKKYWETTGLSRLFPNIYIYGHLGKRLQWGEVAQSCPTLCDPMDCNLLGFSIHGILQARILEWIAISFSRGSSRPRDRTLVSRIGGRRFNLWATREAVW